MLTIFYPKEDYTAADVAVRVQALAAGENQTVQVITKHIRRNQKQVTQQLRQTTAALFIACDRLELDEKSQQELADLQYKNCKIICVVPQDFVELPKSPNIERYTYTQGDTGSFAETVQKFVDKLKHAQQRAAPEQKSDNGAALLIAGGLLVAGIIFLASLNTDKK